ncbi:TPA: dTDP-6-deoxy-D-glucose-3,5-epimerase [Escherichia coli]|nr:dTDP-6-deoxy-D-glucose-3,5-epimerase [Escherichia coli]
MTTITKERLLTIKQWRETYGPGSNVVLPAEEAEELARIALASLEAEKVTLYRERNPYNGMTTGWQELTEQEYKFVKDNASENAEFRTVYTAPPAPVIQADVAQTIEILKQKLVECNRYNYCADAVKGVEDACHAAMLHGKGK